MNSLSETDQAILALEKLRYADVGRKEERIRALGLTPVRYYQRLNELIDTPAALAADPLLISSLRRRRDKRDTARGHTPES